MKSTTVDGVCVPELEALVGTSRAYSLWSEADMAVLDRYYGRVPTKAIAAQLGRSLGSVTNKAQSIGLQGARRV